MTVISVAVNQLPDRYGDDLKAYDSGSDIRELRHYRRMMGFKERGVRYWKDLSDDEIFDKTKHFIELYFEIADRGWNPDLKPLQAHIDRRGRMQFKGGYHRASILRHLGYDTVEVEFTMHDKFKSFYERVCALYPNQRMYQGLDHIVFSTWSCVRGWNRGELINKHIPKRSKVLFVGPYIGQIACELALKGHKVTGVEADSNIIELAKYWSGYKGVSVNYINSDIYTHIQDNNEEYDVIIMLSVDRWIEKQHGWDGLVEVFNWIDNHCDYFLFESRGAHETRALEHLDGEMKKLSGTFNKRELICKDDGEKPRNVWGFS
jgi:2-polyprenyl-3-methyl-5-hydroxy-6-metoxy-1,4-benzoquinol methylase